MKSVSITCLLFVPPGITGSVVAVSSIGVVGIEGAGVLPLSSIVLGGGVV